MNELTQARFDYGQVDEPTRVHLQVKAESIRARMKRTAEDIIAIGQDLIEVKETLGHGRFLEWIKAEFGMAERSARRFMTVAERFADKSDNLAVFPVSILYELAAPSTPETIVEQVQTGEIQASLEEIRKAKAALKEAEDDARRAREQAQAAQQQLFTLQAQAQEKDRQVAAIQAQAEAVRREEQARAQAGRHKRTPVQDSGSVLHGRRIERLSLLL